MSQELRNKLEQLKGKQAKVTEQIQETRLSIRTEGKSLVYYEQARELVRAVGLETQQSLQFHLSDITSMALDAVFEEPYTLKVDFVQRRNKTECDLLFVRNGKEIEPLESSGYGAVDIACFALRGASWSMKHPRSRNTMILDEPFKHLDKLKHPMASRMLKEVSEKLGIQFIIVTHEDTLTESADKVFSVSIKNEVSLIKTN